MNTIQRGATIPLTPFSLASPSCVPMKYVVQCVLETSRMNRLIFYLKIYDVLLARPASETYFHLHPEYIFSMRVGHPTRMSSAFSGSLLNPSRRDNEKKISSKKSTLGQNKRCGFAKKKVICKNKIFNTNHFLKIGVIARFRMYNFRKEVFTCQQSRLPQFFLIIFFCNFAYS